jgi:hypothetical protein
MINAFKTLITILGVFMLIGLRNVSIGQAFFGIFSGTLAGIDTTNQQWNSYQQENTKRGIGKITPYNGKPYSNNDY